MTSSRTIRARRSVLALINLIAVSFGLSTSSHAQSSAVPEPPFSAQQAEFGRALNALYLDLQKQAPPLGPNFNMDAWAAPAEPFKILGNLYSVGPVYGEAFLLTSPQGHILLGAAMDKAADVVHRNIEALGFKITDVKAILLTHNHRDMAGAAAALKARSGAQLMIGFAEIPYVENGIHNPPAIPSGAPISISQAHGTVPQPTPARYPPAKVDRALHDGDVVQVGPLSVTAFLFPGHSPSPASFMFNVEHDGRSSRVLFYCCWEYPMDLRNGYVTEANARRQFETIRDKIYPVDVYLASATFQWGGVLNQASGTLAERIERAKANPQLWINRDIFTGFAAFHEVQFAEEMAKRKAAETAAP